MKTENLLDFLQTETLFQALNYADLATIVLLQFILLFIMAAFVAWNSKAQEKYSVQLFDINRQKIKETYKVLSNECKEVDAALSRSILKVDNKTQRHGVAIEQIDRRIQQILEAILQPKFKVGDRVVYSEENIKGKIVDIDKNQGEFIYTVEERRRFNNPTKAFQVREIKLKLL